MVKAKTVCIRMRGASESGRTSLSRRPGRISWDQIFKYVAMFCVIMCFVVFQIRIIGHINIAEYILELCKYMTYFISHMISLAGNPKKPVSRLKTKFRARFVGD